MSKVGIIEYDKLEIGDSLMNNNTYLREWRCPLLKLTSGKKMFQKCGRLTTFTPDLSSLTNGYYMFHNTNLSSFTSDLSSLTEGDSMFLGCYTLITFTSDLSSLTNGNRMFDNCWELTTFIASDLSSLTNGNRMFYYCYNLTTFTSHLSSLTNGNSMFNGCYRLTTFTSGLSSLTKGSGMFQSCKLNVESVENIASSINTYNGGQITIHVDDTLSETDKNTILSHFTTISVNKGWTVDSNLSTVATVNEDGEIVESTMICAKVDEPYDDYYTHLDNNGNKVILRTAKIVIGPRENEWTVFASLEDAEQFFGLTRIVDELNNNT